MACLLVTILRLLLLTQGRQTASTLRIPRGHQLRIWGRGMGVNLFRGGSNSDCEHGDDVVTTVAKETTTSRSKDTAPTTAINDVKPTIEVNSASKKSSFSDAGQGYKTVSILVPNNQQTSLIRPGVILIETPDDQSNISVEASKGIWEEKTSIASKESSYKQGDVWETLGLTSDIVVLVLSGSRTKNDDFGAEPVDTLVERLGKGLKQRKKSKRTSSQVMIVKNDDSTETEEAAFSKDEFRAYLKLASSARLHWASPASLESKLKHLIQESIAQQEPQQSHEKSEVKAKLSPSTRLPASAHGTLLAKVYASIGGGDGTIRLLDEAQPSAVITVHETKDLVDDNGGYNPELGPKKVPKRQALKTSQSELDSLYSELQQAILLAITSDLDDLEEGLEQAMLSSGLLDFAEFCNPALQDLHDGLDGLPDDISKPILSNVGERLRDLWEQHLQTLRDFYGSRYETLVDGTPREKWQSHAQAITEAFRQVAQDSIPVLTRPGQVFRDLGLDYVVALEGLIADMMEATRVREEDQAEEEHALVADDDDSDNNEVRVVKWYEKLAARALVLSVNYLQGWLAWQGLRRAALDRERNMPKFPLF